MNKKESVIVGFIALIFSLATLYAFFDRDNISDATNIDFNSLTEDVFAYYKPDVSKVEFAKILKHNYIVCNKYKMDFVLNLCKIATESSFKQSAISISNCVGLHQISRILCKDYNIQFAKVKYDAYINSEIGIRYFAQLMKYTNNDINKSLIYYNCGQSCSLFTYVNCKYDKVVLSKYNFFNTLVNKNKKSK